MPLESLSDAEQQVIVSKFAAAAELGQGEQPIAAETDLAEVAGEQAVKQFRRHLYRRRCGH